MKQFLRALAVAASLLLVSSFAMGADTYLSLCQVGPGCIETSGTGTAAFTGTSFGSFSLNNVSITGYPFLPSGDLDLASLDVTSSTASTGGTLYVFASQIGLTQPIGTVKWNGEPTGTFTNAAGNQITYAAYFNQANVQCDAANGASPNSPYCPGTNLFGNKTFTTSPFSTDLSATVNGVTAPYALTQVFIITLKGASQRASLDAGLYVPEPASLLLMGTGFLALGGTFRRKLLKK